MSLKVVVMEKLENAEMRQVDERHWNEAMVAALNHSNYLLVGGKEYEMLEGRLNVNDQLLELLVTAVKE